MSSRSVRFTDPPNTPDRTVAAPPDLDAVEEVSPEVDTVFDIPADSADLHRSVVSASGLDANGAARAVPVSELRITYRPNRIGQWTIPGSVPAEVLEPPDVAIVAEEARALESVNGDESTRQPPP